MQCPVIESGHVIGRKWAIPIIEEIASGKFSGFNKFVKKSRNITARTLSIQLKELEAAGLVEKSNNEHKNRKTTSYSLTGKGQELHRIITEIKGWNIKWNNVPAHCLKLSCTECQKYNGPRQA